MTQACCLTVSSLCRRWLHIYRTDSGMTCIWKQVAFRSAPLSLSLTFDITMSCQTICVSEEKVPKLWTVFWNPIFSTTLCERGCWQIKWAIDSVIHSVFLNWLQIYSMSQGLLPFCCQLFRLFSAPDNDRQDECSCWSCYHNLIALHDGVYM